MCCRPWGHKESTRLSDRTTTKDLPRSQTCHLGGGPEEAMVEALAAVRSLSRVRLCDPLHCITPGLPVQHHLPEFAQTHVHCSVMPSNHLILCRPLLLLPSIFPSIRIFSSESVLCIRWPEYWGFSFSISASNEYSGLISFRID